MLRLSVSRTLAQGTRSLAPYGRWLAGTSGVAHVRTLATAPAPTSNPPRLSAFEQLLTAGGDDRSHIKPETGTNKYHCAPRPVTEGMIFRGSCTCNPPTRRGYAMASDLYARFEGLDKHGEGELLGAVMAEMRERLHAAFQLPEGAEVILCPSGSDAEYIPIAIARALVPETGRSRKIVNIVTQLREVGAGTAPAAGGEFFSTHTPLSGALPSHMVNGRLSGMDDSALLSHVDVPARGRDGSVTDTDAAVADALSAAEEEGSYAIVHGVFGGKTGMMDAQMPRSRGSSHAASESLAVIDACQGRFSLEELHSWLEEGSDAVVLITGSKFYQGPPFAGAVIVPPRVAALLRESPAPSPREMYDAQLGLGAFLSTRELPEALKHWGQDLSERNNVGLALRWEASLAGVEALADVADDERSAAVERWAAATSAMVQEEPLLDAWCVNRSIVSIRVAKAVPKEEKSGSEEWRSMEELRHLYRWMSLDVSAAVAPEDAAPAATRCFIGQPVDVAESHAIVRIALGADALAAFCKEDEGAVLAEDRAAVAKLAAVARNFDRLLESGL